MTTTLDDPIVAKLGEVRAEIARLRAENERLIRERDGLRKNFDGAIADLRETERERERLRADVETLAHKLEDAEGDLRRAEHDLRATIQAAIPAIRAGINALGSSEADVRSRNAARDSLHALEAAVEGAEPPAAVLSAAPICDSCGTGDHPEHGCAGSAYGKPECLASEGKEG